MPVRKIIPRALAAAVIGLAAVMMWPHQARPRPPVLKWLGSEPAGIFDDAGQMWFLIGFIAVWWCAAQTNNPSKKPVTTDSSPALDRLSALISFLETNKQTNALRLFYEYSNASIAQQHSADIGLTLHILMALREGHTTNAMELLEGRLDTEVIGFAASFKELPESQRSWLGLHSLSEARWYRGRFPHKHPYRNVDEGVARAFELLDKNTVR